MIKNDKFEEFVQPGAMGLNIPNFSSWKIYADRIPTCDTVERW